MRASIVMAPLVCVAWCCLAVPAPLEDPRSDPLTESCGTPGDVCVRGFRSGGSLLPVRRCACVCVGGRRQARVLLTRSKCGVVWLRVVHGIPIGTGQSGRREREWVGHTHAAMTGWFRQEDPGVRAHPVCDHLPQFVRRDRAHGVCVCTVKDRDGGKGKRLRRQTSTAPPSSVPWWWWCESTWEGAG